MVSTMVTDIRCQEMPVVEYGACNLKERMRKMEQAAAEGILAVVATPHFNEQMDRTALEQYIRGWDQLHTLMQKKKISITLYPGNEIFYSENALRSLARGEAMGMNDTRYVLVEFAPYTDYRYMRMAIQQMQYEGYWPILAHVERYTNVINRMDKAVGLKEDTGCYFQVNAASITGEYGFTTKKVTRKLLREELVEFIATDAHRNEGKRSPKMKACAEWVEKKMGREKAEKIFRRNPEAILADQMM